jgi:hypothetical protein
VWPGAGDWTLYTDVCRSPARFIGAAAGPGGVVGVCSSGEVFQVLRDRPTPWKISVEAPAGVAWIGDDLLVSTVRGELVRVGADGTERWRIATLGAAPLGVGTLDGGRLAYVRGPRGTWILDAASGVERAVLPALQGPPVDADGTMWGLDAVERVVRAWRLPERWPIPRYVASQGLATLAWSPDGTRLAIGGGAIVSWEVATGRTTRLPFPEGVAKGIAWDGEAVLAAISGPNTVLRSSGAAAEPFGPPGARVPLRRLGRLTDGAFVGVTYTDGGPVVWDESGVRGQDSSGLPRLHDLGMGPGGDGAAALGVDGGVWVVGAGPPVRPVVLPDARAVALGPGGLLAVATDTAVRVFRGSEERRSWPVPGPTTLDLAWSPDGRWITTAHLEGRAILWDVGTGRHVATFGLHEDRVAALDFSPSGELLATVSWDRSARLWRLAPVINPPLPAAEEARWGVTLAQALGDGSG